jgi:hypothetical protein
VIKLKVAEGLLQGKNEQIDNLIKQNAHHHNSHCEGDTQMKVLEKFISESKSKIKALEGENFILNQ